MRWDGWMDGWMGRFPMGVGGVYFEEGFDIYICVCVWIDEEKGFIKLKFILFLVKGGAMITIKTCSRIDPIHGSDFEPSDPKACNASPAAAPLTPLSQASPCQASVTVVHRRQIAVLLGSCPFCL